MSLATAQSYYPKLGKQVAHLAFWLGMYVLYLSQFYIFNAYEAVADEFPLGERLFIVFIHLLPVVAFSYFLCYRVFPLIFEKKETWLGIAELLIGLYLLAVLSRLSKVYLMEPLLSKQFAQKETVWEIMTQWKTLVKYYIVTIGSGALPFVVFHLLSERLRMIRNEAVAQSEKQAAELKALKNQLNPHFLFNILNSIYSLAVQGSSLTPVAVARLSDMLDYLLYRCNEKFVPLQNEIDFLNNYLELQKMRFGDRLTVKTDFSTDGQFYIAPLILLTVVENMFKHGVENSNKRVDLNIQLHSTGPQLQLKTSNPFDGTVTTPAGIGLRNLQHQLTLLYPGQHSISFNKTADRFELQLQILLA